MDRSTVASPARGRLLSHAPERTRAIGRALGAAAAPGTVLALTGELGAGKTQLAKGVADGLEVRAVVNSPTFVLMNEHSGRLPMYHVDAYRLSDPEEALAAGLIDERQADGVVVIEWADRLDGWLPQERLDIAMQAIGPDPSVRELRWEARGAAHERLANEAFAER